MSLIGVLRTGVSGMNAQSNRISTVAENIQNSSTTGYKRTATEFSSLLLDSADSGNYNSGAVETTIRRSVSEQGPVSFTTSPTDLAIQGSGFFMVRDANNASYLTRSGNFVVDGPTGNLVNAGGFTLLGYGLLPNGEPNIDGGLVPVTLPTTGLQAQASTEAKLAGNLPLSVAVQTTAPGTAAGTYSQKTSVVAYDSLGQKVPLDVYMTRTASDTWTVQVYDRATPPVKQGEGTVSFDAKGQAVGTPSITLAGTGGTPAMSVSLGSLTQLGAEYDVKTSADGSAPKAGTGVSIATDGTVYATFADSSRAAVFRIPLADVRSPDNLQPRAGNVYETTAESGSIEIGTATRSGRGTIKAGALEQSNVDVSTELTTMIESQSVYTANSKVFMTGNELLDTLMNLKR
ncbi:flagellar hook protein FlgE [Methylobacterium dankookense]|uniref:Flagellar hook protein FlgE n=1 Tax=Methylobacterium dankookense TaxID=560405 RepID=A0A564G5P7_9HYPH|nr:flagellar hook protein FlgE [Methylobacterium dankookense]GJD56624.1 Flagellar hook protein FlgE [Methylobacterium dankookense]VUF15354.1 Flagellar hook protein FlgE [Methylobacterium dankookense]